MKRIAAILACALGLATAASADPVEARARAIVSAPPERVLALLASFETWGRVFVSVDTLGAERLDASRARLRQVAHRAGRTLAYTLLATVDPRARRVDVRLDPAATHDLAVLRTIWEIRPEAGGGSVIDLRVVTESGLPVPAFLERHIAESTTHTSLGELVDALDTVLVSDTSPAAR